MAKVPRTPLEAYIAGETDRRAKYDKRQRDKGLTRTAVWVPADKLTELRAFVAALNTERETA